MNQCFPQVSRHFCRDRCWSPGFLCDVCSVCTDFYHYPENGEGSKEVNPWAPALHTCIPYGHLGNSWRTSFHSAGLSHPSTILIEKIAFLWTSISKVLWDSNFPVFFRTITQLLLKDGACVTGLPFRPIVILSRRRRILVHTDSVSLAH